MKNQRQQINQEKERQRNDTLTQKYMNAQLIKHQQQEAKDKLNMYK